PVLRVVRERAIGIHLQEPRERPRRILIATRLELLERGLIAGLVRYGRLLCAAGRHACTRRAGAAGIVEIARPRRGVRAEALIRSAGPGAPLRLERLQPLIDVEVELALPFGSALGLEA